MTGIFRKRTFLRNRVEDIILMPIFGQKAGGIDIFFIFDTIDKLCTVFSPHGKNFLLSNKASETESCFHFSLFPPPPAGRWQMTENVGNRVNNPLSEK